MFYAMCMRNHRIIIANVVDTIPYHVTSPGKTGLYRGPVERALDLYTIKIYNTYITNTIKMERHLD